MVPPKFRNRLLAVLAVGMLLAGLNVVRAEDDRDRKARVALALTGADEQRDRKVKAALALASTSEEHRPGVVAVAPMPKAKSLCDCGPGCKCGDKCPSCAPAKRADVAAVREAIVRVRQGNAQGSGTVVWSDNGNSVVLTAAHVVAGAGEVTVRADGRTHKAVILGRDTKADLAALLVSADLFAVSVSEADPETGTEVLMVGLTSLWSKGRIKGSEALGGSEFLLLSYDSDSGDSGAGVFANGELIGVHCGKCGASPDTTSTPYCAGSKPVRTFLARFLKRDGKKMVLIVPVPMPAEKPATKPPAERKIIGYQCYTDRFGRKVCVPVYEP